MSIGHLYQGFLPGTAVLLSVSAALAAGVASGQQGDAISVVLPESRRQDAGWALGCDMVVQALRLPRGWLGLYPVIATALPLFGAVSSYGAASVLGVPLVLALPTTSQVIVINAAALSLIVALGDLMPPTALAGLFAAQVVGEARYVRVLRWCIAPGLVAALVALLFIQFAEPLGRALVFFSPVALTPSVGRWAMIPLRPAGYGGQVVAGLQPAPLINAGRR